MQWLGTGEFQKALQECLPHVRDYRWMVRVLHARFRHNGRSFPHKVHQVLRRLGNPRKPFFIGEFPDGTRYLGDYRDINSMSYALAAYRSEEPSQGIAPLLKNGGGAFVDIGANLGLISAAVARQHPDREVLAFEPVPGTVRRAAATFALNDLQNVRLFAAAAGDSDGELVFYDAPHCSEYASAIPTAQSISIDWTAIRVPCCRLDTLCAERIIPRVAFLKIDAEGFEPKVLAGATDLIRRDHPTILYEYNSSIAPHAGWTASDVAQMIASWKPYCFSIYQGCGTGEPFTPPQELGGLANILCQPQDLKLEYHKP